MTSVDEIKLAIESLPKREYLRLLDWILKKDWEAWDRQLEVDAAAGKLDFLVKEALDAKKRGKLQEL